MRTKCHGGSVLFRYKLLPKVAAVRRVFSCPDPCKLSRTFIPALGKQRAKKVKKKRRSGEFAILPAPKVEALWGSKNEVKKGVGNITFRRNLTTVPKTHFSPSLKNEA